MTLYWHETGPLLRYGKGILQIEDLNPQVATKWGMTRLEMFKTGLRFIIAATTKDNAPNA